MKRLSSVCAPKANVCERRTDGEYSQHACALKTVETLRIRCERDREREERKRTHIILRGRHDEDDDDVMLLPRFFAEENDANPVVRSRFARGEMKDFIQLKVFQSAFAIQRNAL